MPMLKTAAAGTTTIANVKRYLEKERVDRDDPHSSELTLFEKGGLQLSQAQLGRLEGYLEVRSRALAVDVSEDLTKRNWAREMDYTRARFRHDRPTKTGTPRTYYHFILSPDIDDACDLKTLRAYATTWVRENFRNEQRTHQYAIVYHDDNLKGVPHAHIVVNVTDKASGRKIQINNDEVVRLGNSAQEIGLRFNLKPIRDDIDYTHVGVRTSQPVYMTGRERAILAKGGYSWKQELREVIWDAATRSISFEDFRTRLKYEGFDVASREKRTVDKEASPDESGGNVYKVEYEYLLYTHKNGKTVRDEKLGAKFYRESLEREFVRDPIIDDDRRFDPWELVKITRGEIPWKEDIRRAVDQVAETVLSIPELHEELERQFGIRLSVNNRGITYVHSSGFKARDISLGLRYTAEGLRQNAVVGEMGSGDPSGSTRINPKHSGFYLDLVKMMERNGMVSLDDVTKVLGNRYLELKEEKAELVSLKQELAECSRLAALQSGYEKEAAFLEKAGSDLPEGALMRLEQAGRYLRDRSEGDARARQKELSKQYEQRLGLYQEKLDALSRDQAVYDRLLEAHGGSAAPAQSIYNVSKTLSKHHISSFHQLDQMIFRADRQHLLAEKRFKDADDRLRRIQMTVSDIRSCREAESLLSPANMASEVNPLSLEVHQIRLRDATSRLAAAGIKEEDFEKQENLYRHAQQERLYFKQKLEQAASTLDELKEAKSTCESMQGYYKSLIERVLDQGKKGGASSAGGTAKAISEATRQAPAKAPKQDVSELPIEEAKRRRQERLRSSPEQSARHTRERTV